VKDIYDIVAESKKRLGEPLALATLVRTQGSSYRRPGARLLICPDGEMVGSLTGGCIEEEIAERAKMVIQSGEPALIDFDTRRRFGCHGKIDILIERVEPSFFAGIARHLDQRRCCVVTTTIKESTVTAREAVSLPNDFGPEVDSFPNSPFVQEIHPPIRLLILGDGPDSAALRKMCTLLGWEGCEVGDARTLAFEPDHWTAAMIKSHNFGRDFVALARFLPLNLRYVGLIGPKKRRDELLSELLQIGVAINAGFFAPAGLDLNAETPEEIALSVVSEIQRVFADGSGQSLRDRKLPIHRTETVSAVQPTTPWQQSGP
jgi:xanthine dehydrogenase accessory factor